MSFKKIKSKLHNPKIGIPKTATGNKIILIRSVSQLKDNNTSSILFLDTIVFNELHIKTTKTVEPNTGNMKYENQKYL